MKHPTHAAQRLLAVLASMAMLLAALPAGAYAEEVTPGTTQPSETVAETTDTTTGTTDVTTDTTTGTDTTTDPTTPAEGTAPTETPTTTEGEPTTETDQTTTPATNDTPAQTSTEPTNTEIETSTTEITTYASENPDELGYKYEGETLTILNDNYKVHAGEIIWNETLRESFTAVVVNEGVTALPDWAFQNLKNVTTITLPDSLKTIGQYAFERMSGITEITIPKNVETIGGSVFNGCDSLTKIKGYNDVAKSAAEAANIAYVSLAQPASSGTGYTITDTTLTITSDEYNADSASLIRNSEWCKANLTAVIVNEGVTTIPGWAFQWLGKINNITLPESLTNIGQWAFQGTAITEITIPKATVTLTDAFQGVDSLITVKGYTNAAETAATAANKTYVDLAKVQLAGISVSLDGSIGINYYAAIKDSVTSTAYIEFTLPGGKKETIAANTVTPVEVPSLGTGTYYKFTCKVTSAEMTQNVTATLHSGEDEDITDEYTTSVRDYANEDTNASDTALLNAMRNYGGYVQTHFNLHTDDLANKDLYTDGANPVTEFNTSLDKYAPTYTPEIKTGFNIVGASLILNSETALRIYYTLDDGKALSNYTINVNDGGISYTVGTNSNGAYIEIANIPAHKLSGEYTITVTDKSADGTTTLKYYPLSYAKTVIEDESSPAKYKDSEVNMAKALVLYSNAADTFAAAQTN